MDPPGETGTDFSAVNGRDVVAIAPFWSNNDIRTLNSIPAPVRYESYGMGPPFVDARLAVISEFISNKTVSNFSGTWMLLAEWRGCPPFPAGDSTLAASYPDPDYLTQVSQLALYKRALTQCWCLLPWQSL